MYLYIFSMKNMFAKKMNSKWNFNGTSTKFDKRIVLRQLWRTLNINIISLLLWNKLRNFDLRCFNESIIIYSPKVDFNVG